jgi:para-nitrobenzyl esterase
VVLVTINYRLGVFGFLATTDLAKEAGGTARELRPAGHGGSARVGPRQTSRSLAAIRQRDHLRRERGIVCGEHADGVALAQGLFEKAIGESGGAFSDVLPLDRWTRARRRTTSGWPGWA